MGVTRVPSRPGGVGWSPEVPPHVGHGSSEAAGRAACPGRAPGPASLGASWEQLVAPGQSHGAASPA